MQLVAQIPRRKSVDKMADLARGGQAPFPKEERVSRREIGLITLRDLAVCRN